MSDGERVVGEFEGKQRPAGCRGLDSPGMLRQAFLDSYTSPQVIENVSEPLPKAVQVSESPLNPERGMILTPKSARSQVIYSSYPSMGLGAERAVESSHPRGSSPSLLSGG